MWHRFLLWLDDAIIDHLFQPVVNWIRHVTGWSKRVPCAFSLGVASMLFVRPCVRSFSELTVSSNLLGLYLLGAIVISSIGAFTFLTQEMETSEDEEDGSIDDERVRYRDTRIYAPIYLLCFIGIGIFNFLFSDSEAVGITVGFTFLVCFLYFLSCISPPRGKTIIERTKEHVEGWFLIPVPLRAP